MKRIELTESAAKALENITYWTEKNFGAVQAEKYHKALVSRIRKLAAGEYPRGRPLAALLGWQPQESDLRYSRVGRHSVIYLDKPDCIIVTDFLHDAQDVDNHFLL